jgi:membrane protease YdiL (CAAX protease family)
MNFKDIWILKAKTMTLFIIWIVLCFIIGHYGSKRKIGGTLAFLAAFLLSPLIGFIVVALSDKK